MKQYNLIWEKGKKRLALERNRDFCNIYPPPPPQEGPSEYAVQGAQNP